MGTNEPVYLWCWIRRRDGKAGVQAVALHTLLPTDVRVEMFSVLGEPIPPPEPAKKPVPPPSDLLPCPFCGKAVAWSHIPGSWGYTHSEEQVRCNDCGIGFKEDSETWSQVKGMHSIVPEARAKVKARWNRRAEDGKTCK